MYTRKGNKILNRKTVTNMDHVHHVLTLFENQNQNHILPKDAKCFYKNLKTGEIFEREHGFSETSSYQVCFKKQALLLH